MFGLKTPIFCLDNLSFLSIFLIAIILRLLERAYFSDLVRK